MFKNHPKGLIVAFFANMGERFGFYTMMAILVLFLQAKYGLTEEKAGNIYSWFYFSIYALALVGGMLADYTKKYKMVIMAGIITMFAGYSIMAIPGLSLGLTIAGLFTIAFGNGLFKGNLQAVVGQMYDNPRYSAFRDQAYMIFYMGINIGAFIAPFAATGIRNWMLEANGFLHDGSLPALCHQVIDGTLQDRDGFLKMASAVSLNGPVTDIGTFAREYLAVFSRGYNYAFGIAAGAMVISLLVYIFFKKLLPNKEQTLATGGSEAPKMEAKPLAILAGLGAMGITAFVVSLFLEFATGLAFGLFAGFVVWILMTSNKEERPRVGSLVLVFFVVVFFWMSFHQNGLTLTYFARDYTVKTVDAFTNLFFTLPSILSLIAAVAGLVLIFTLKKVNEKLLGAGLMVVGGVLCWYFVNRNQSQNAIAPEIFQSFNPLFIVSLTFLVMGIFAWLNKRGKEPSTPKKIGIGMIIASIGFLVVLIASLSLVSPKDLVETVNGVVSKSPVPDTSRVAPYWLINSYLVLTIAELFLSPMGLSFVSKVAPARFQGLMQGGWLLATAVGNKLLFVGSYFWNRLELWQLWAIFVICCLLSAAFIFSIMKRLERVTKTS
ncbi:MAG: peptide MFS transporter [Bacteroidales bacterium]